MKRALLALIVISGVAYAGGPLFRYQDPKIDQEFNNVYKDLKRVGSGGVANPLTANLAAGGFKLTGLGAGSAAGESIRFEQLKILQVVVATTVTPFTTASNTFQSTNLSASITPSNANSKVLILASGVATTNDLDSDSMCATIARGTTNLAASQGLAELASSALSGYFQAGVSMIFLDSPATTSATTYRVRIKNSGGGVTMGFGATNTTQVMILAEVNGI